MGFPVGLWSLWFRGTPHTFMWNKSDRSANSWEGRCQNISSQQSFNQFDPTTIGNPDSFVAIVVWLISSDRLGWWYAYRGILYVYNYVLLVNFSEFSEDSSPRKGILGGEYFQKWHDFQISELWFFTQMFLACLNDVEWNTVSTNLPLPIINRSLKSHSSKSGSSACQANPLPVVSIQRSISISFHCPLGVFGHEIDM